MFNRFLGVVFVFLALFILFPKPAYAYLDPGTLSFVMQMIVAAFVGLLVVLRIYWKKVKGFIGRIFSRNKKDEP